ncbi:unnamed protein product [Cyprideis torosa]|uniref:Uncharacterized protein n=1 Tax=Cyprideis torosa TaxID=163714 RepID=A0A7R8ZTJ5_9CRUS|nr:unnamed protein product [Cyprideis torosa]CAG0898203.1 unnamed protein product [Cyprideis torosa]
MMNPKSAFDAAMRLFTEAKMNLPEAYKELLHQTPRAGDSNSNSPKLTKYRYPDIMKSEVRSVVQHYPQLKPTFTEYVSKDGKTMELICLKGVIPVTYKENQYNIPVEIYVQDAHPYATPTAYVKPTQDMWIKPSRNVNENGLVFLPYLHEWKPYRYPDIMESEVRSVVQHYPQLKPTFTEYVFKDGKTMELICLKGAIPVTYKENQYNIPIEIYVQDAHPYATPIAYVKPTQDMWIKPSRNVNENGLVFLPYLHEWKPNQSDLLGLVQVMCVVFGDRSPVYNRLRPQANIPVNTTRPAYPFPPTGCYGASPQPPYTSNPSPGYPAAPAAGGYYPPTRALSSPSAMPLYSPVSQIPLYPSQIATPDSRSGQTTMDPLRQLQVKRRPLRGTVDRLTKELDDLVLNGQRNKHAPNLRKNIVSAIKQASEKKNLLQKLDDEVKDLILASNDEDAYDLEYAECEKIMDELSTSIVGGEEFLQSLETTAASNAMSDEGEEVSQKTEKGDVLQHVTDPAVKQLYVKRRPVRGTVNKIITKLLNVIDDPSGRPNVLEVKKTVNQATEKLKILENLDEQIKDTLLSHEQQNIQDLYEAEYEEYPSDSAFGPWAEAAEKSSSYIVSCASSDPLTVKPLTPSIPFEFQDMKLLWISAVLAVTSAASVKDIGFPEAHETLPERPKDLPEGSEHLPEGLAHLPKGLAHLPEGPKTEVLVQVPMAEAGDQLEAHAEPLVELSADGITADGVEGGTADGVEAKSGFFGGRRHFEHGKRRHGGTVVHATKGFGHGGSFRHGGKHIAHGAKVLDMEEVSGMEAKISFMEVISGMEAKILDMEEVSDMEAKISLMEEVLNMEEVLDMEVKILDMQEVSDMEAKILVMEEVLDMEAKILDMEEVLDMEVKILDMQEVSDMEAKILVMEEVLDMEAKILSMEEVLGMQANTLVMEVPLDMESKTSFTEATSGMAEKTLDLDMAEKTLDLDMEEKTLDLDMVALDMVALDMVALDMVALDMEERILRSGAPFSRYFFGFGHGGIGHGGIGHGGIGHGGIGHGGIGHGGIGHGGIGHGGKDIGHGGRGQDGSFRQEGFGQGRNFGPGGFGQGGDFGQGGFGQGSLGQGGRFRQG